jgi:hypothetical protein
MKKRIYLAIIILPLLFTRCVPEVEDIFDSPASERLAAKQKEIRSLLVSAENGWLVDYYMNKAGSNNGTKTDPGGYAMHVTFHVDGTADVASERETHVAAGVVATSGYDILTDQSVVLSFNDYNQVLHYFSEPKGSSDVTGLGGDYEFVVVENTNDVIEMTGKKWGRRIVMRRCDPTFDFLAYIRDVEVTADLVSAFGMFAFQEDDETLFTTTVVERVFNATTTVINGTDTTEVTTKLPYIVTPGGIRLYTPYVNDKNGRVMENFTWDATNDKYVCVDPGVNIEGVIFYPPDYQLKYEEFLGRWAFKCQGYVASDVAPYPGVVYTDTAVLALKKKNATYDLNFLHLFPDPTIEVTFDATKGTIAIAVQNLSATPAGNIFRFIFYSRGANSTYSTIGSYGLKGTWNHDEGGVRIINLENDGRSTLAAPNGFIIRAFLPNSSTTASTDSSITGRLSNGNYIGNSLTLFGTSNYRFYNAVFTKIDE